MNQYSYQVFGLISSVLSNRRFRLVLDDKSSQEYPINAGVPHGTIIGSTLFPLYINDLPDDVICNIAIYANDTTLYSTCDQVSDMWQQLEIVAEFESDLRDTGNGLLIAILENSSCFVGAIDVKMDKSFLDEKSSFKMLGLSFSSKLDWGCYIISTAKTASKKIGALVRSMKFY